MNRKSKSPQMPKADQPLLPGQLISQVMQRIRASFCVDWTGQQWGQWFDFIRREVVTWPAGFMWAKGFALPQERFLQVLLGVLNDIQVHGNTGEIKFIPGYLQKCVQRHFRIHWEEYYAEAKRAGALADLVVLGLKKGAAASGSERKVEALAHVHQALKADRLNKKKPRKPQGEQLSFF